MEVAVDWKMLLLMLALILSGAVITLRWNS